MKQLSILRHAKAESPDSAAVDFERKLTERGQHDAQRIGKILKHMKPPVEWVLSSPADRALETTNLVLSILDEKPYVNWQQGIYEASPGTLLHLLSGIPDGIEHALIVGHNPGLEELVAGLCNGVAAHPTITLATATLAHLELDIFSWDQIRWGCGSLQLLVTPKVLR